MACRCAPACLQLVREIDELWPGRDRASDGCCASAQHSVQNPSSRHEPAKTGVARGLARARDVDEDLQPGTGLNLRWLWDSLCRHPDPRLRMMIYERMKVYPNSTTDRRPSAYGGANPHDKHLHAEVFDDAALDTSSWGVRERFEQALRNLLDKPDRPIVIPDAEVPYVVANEIVRVLPTGDPMVVPGLIPCVRVRRDGSVEAVNGAFEGRGFPGSLPGIGEHRSDVVDLIPYSWVTDERGVEVLAGYTIVTSELRLDGSRYVSACFTFTAS